MSNFLPGKIVADKISKKRKKIIIRYPKWEDIDQLIQYINLLSKEDTFILFSGEEIRKEEEVKALSKWFVDMEIANKVVLVVE